MLKSRLGSIMVPETGDPPANEAISEQRDDSRVEKEAQVDEQPAEVCDKSAEKPLEKMTKAELLEELKERQTECKNNYELYLRSQAEMENIKKRNSKEKQDWLKYANETLIKDLLPVIDNLENAISHAHDENSITALKEGVELTLKGLKDTLAKSGLDEVKAQGEPFDPSFHHAVSEREDESVNAGLILQELQRGYTLHQRLIRPAMVVVSKGKTSDASSHHTKPGGK